MLSQRPCWCVRRISTAPAATAATSWGTVSVGGVQAPLRRHPEDSTHGLRYQTVRTIRNLHFALLRAAMFRKVAFHCGAVLSYEVQWRSLAFPVSYPADFFGSCPLHFVQH